MDQNPALKWMRCEILALREDLRRKASGSHRDRPQLKDALVSAEAGDTRGFVWKLSRLARSLHTKSIKQASDIAERGIASKC